MYKLHIYDWYIDMWSLNYIKILVLISNLREGLFLLTLQILQSYLKCKHVHLPVLMPYLSIPMLSIIYQLISWYHELLILVTRTEEIVWTLLLPLRYHFLFQMWIYEHPISISVTLLLAVGHPHYCNRQWSRIRLLMTVFCYTIMLVELNITICI